jgi:hypothetical protein
MAVYVGVSYTAVMCPESNHCGLFNTFSLTRLLNHYGLKKFTHTHFFRYKSIYAI